jgi:hypothetical protein
VVCNLSAPLSFSPESPFGIVNSAPPTSISFILFTELVLALTLIVPDCATLVLSFSNGSKNIPHLGGASVNLAPPTMIFKKTRRKAVLAFSFVVLDCA